MRSKPSAPPRIREPIAIDVGVEAGDWPDELVLAALSRKAIEAALDELAKDVPPSGAEVSLVFTDDRSIQTLNAEWRGKDKATNVLSFPAFPPDKSGPLPPMLGDIVLASETVKREAEDENKPFENHLTHLIVHGFLHLAGFDHEVDEEAEEMEAVERRILARLAIPDPYA